MSASVGVSAETLKSISTPDRVESRLGTLEFDDGAPSAETAALLYDNLDFMAGVQAFLGAIPGASLAALRRGFKSVGVEDNAFTLFPELMDSNSLFLTANSDTVYFWGFVDLSDGPMVVDVPPLGAPSGILGTIDDMWFRWVTDLGLPGPDRAAGGRYLIVGPGYDGPLPDGGFHVSHSRTTRVTALGRAFMIDNDPRTPTQVIREGLRVSRYEPGTQGTAVGTYLNGGAPLGAPSAVPEARFVDLSGTSFNTVYPNDFSYWELVHELVQQEPPGAGDPDLMGLLRIGRDRSRQAVRARRAHAQDSRRRGRGRQRHGAHRHLRGATRGRLRLLPGLGMVQRAVRRWLRVPRPAPEDHCRRPGPGGPERRCPARSISRTNFFYMATGITPAMCEPPIPPTTPASIPHCSSRGRCCSTGVPNRSDLTDAQHWWRWMTGAHWRHPDGRAARYMGVSSTP